MTSEELLEKIKQIRESKCETRMLEIKAAHTDCPRRLYDTLSAFSNQDDGGVIIFGIDEENDFNECGVYDRQDIQKKINEQCLQMEPAVRPLITVAEKEGRYFVSAEIPGIDITERPCFYQGKGRLKGSYVRVGDSDEPMTEYEIYSFEAFRRKHQDDIRTIPGAKPSVLDVSLVDKYIDRIKAQKKNIGALPDDMIRELMSVTRNGEVTLSSLLLFCLYPQVFLPQICITATALPGELGEAGDLGERFLDNQRIEGNIPDMLEQAIAFIVRNTKTKTIVNPDNGRREDRTEYPVTAVREALLNALVHRDYSIHTEGMPVQVMIFRDRLEIRNPGGIYGRLKIDQLGKMQPDTRNPVLATALETLGITENRYSGIPTIRRAMAEAGLKEPVFSDERGTFTVVFYNSYREMSGGSENIGLSSTEKAILTFLETPRSRKEIAEYLGVSTVVYAIKMYVEPMIEKGLVSMTMPEKPRSPKQKYVRSAGSKA